MSVRGLPQHSARNCPTLDVCLRLVTVYIYNIYNTHDCPTLCAHDCPTLDVCLRLATVYTRLSHPVRLVTVYIRLCHPLWYLDLQPTLQPV